MNTHGPSALTDAIRHYHDLLSPALAADSHEALVGQQSRRGLGFGDRPLCTVLRPRFLTPDQYRLIRQRVAVLMNAFLTVHDAAVADPAFRSQFLLSPQEEELFLIDPGFPCPMPTSRLDAFFVPDQAGKGLRFTEFNAETPAGGGYCDELADIFSTLPVMAAFQRRYHALSPPIRPGITNALLGAFTAWRGVAEKPVIGILDWLDVPTYSEFVTFRDFFTRHGLDAVIGDVRACDYRGNRLYVDGKHVTLIYKRVLISELIERGGRDHPLLRALRDRAVCMVNPPRCKALYKKASLAVLSDEANAGLFTAEQRQAIDDHIPWTRVVAERRTRFEGREVDLIPFLQSHKDHLVLKPNDDYGGKGIVLGWTVDAPRWEEAVQTALTTPYVIQHRVTLPTEPFPAWAGGTLHVGDRMLDTAPYVSMGSYVEGCLTRIGTDPLLNVTAGGGSTVPTFVVEPR